MPNLSTFMPYVLMVIALGIHFLLTINEERAEIFSYQETIFKESDTPPTDPERPNFTTDSPGFQTIVNQRKCDKRKSLFGHNIIIGRDSTSLIISAPGQKDSTGAYSGDVFLCTVGSLENHCRSFIKDTTMSRQNYISTEVLPPLFGISITRINENHVMICQAYLGVNNLFHDNCYCVKEEIGILAKRMECLFPKSYYNIADPSTNILRVHMSTDKNILTMISRLFHYRTRTSKLIVTYIEENSSPDIPSFLRDTKNIEWLPTLGFGVGSISETDSLSFVFATNDYDYQRGQLFIYDGFPDEKVERVIENSNGEAFSNFGKKIVIADVNNDRFNDLLVSSPTSKWLDLPQVGYVNIFLNTKSYPFFTSKSLITIRGKLVANSLFGFNVISSDDLNGDGITDILVAALKLDEEDQRGGIYIFLGGDSKYLKESSYHQIIRPQTTASNVHSGFGFAMNMETLLREQSSVKKPQPVLITSRLFDGEVDIFKQNSINFLKVNVKITPQNILVDQNFVSSLLSESRLFVAVEICLRDYDTSQEFKIHLSFVDTSLPYSFSPNFKKDTLSFTKKFQDNPCEEHAIHLRPWFTQIPLKWVFQADVTPVEKTGSSNVDQLYSYFQRKFFSELTFQVICDMTPCAANFDVMLPRKPILIMNSGEPINFELNLKNLKIFLTHLIIEADMSIPCDIEINIDQNVKIYEPTDNSLSPTNSPLRVLYSRTTQDKGHLYFTVKAICSQIYKNFEVPSLKLSIQSFSPHIHRNFRFYTMRKYDFVLEVVKLPITHTDVCWLAKSAVKIEFNAKVLIRGPGYDEKLMLQAVLKTDKVGVSVISFDIRSTDCEFFDVQIIKYNLKTLFIKKFKIRPISNKQEIILSFQALIQVKTSKDFNVTLHLDPLSEPTDKYIQPIFMTDEAIFYTVIRVKLCRREIYLLIFATFICFMVTLGFGLMMYSNFSTPVIRNTRQVTYIVGADKTAVQR